MKNGWERKRLRDVTTKIGSGATPRGGEAAYKAAGISLIRSLNVYDDGFRKKDLAFLDDKQAGRLNNVIVEPGDVLLNITGASVARCCLAPNDHLPSRVNQHVSIVRPIKHRLLPECLHYMLISREYKNRLLAVGEDGGSTRQAITKAQIQEFEIEVPPLLEQQRIVAILDEAFKRIGTVEVNAGKNFQNARALFESHLNAVFSRRGNGWHLKPLGSLCELVSGQHIDAKDYNIDRKGVAYLTGPSDFGPRNPIITKWTEHPKRMAKAGDILITVKGSGVGKVNLLDHDEVAISRQLMAVRVTSTDVEYLYAFLSTNFGYFQSLSNGAAIPGISREDVLHLMCPIPPLGEQHSIVKRISCVANETQRLAGLYQRKLNALDVLKKSLLHRAFAGELTASKTSELIEARA